MHAEMLVKLNVLNGVIWVNKVESFHGYPIVCIIIPVEVFRHIVDRNNSQR